MGKQDELVEDLLELAEFYPAAKNYESIQSLGSFRMTPSVQKTRDYQMLWQEDKNSQGCEKL